MNVLAESREIAVFRALQLGDLLCSIPALRALRAAAPRARITLIGLPWARLLSERFPCYIDDFIEFPGWPGWPERTCDTAALPGFFGETRMHRFDLAVQMHGSGETSNRLVAALGARRTAGFFMPGGAPREPELYLPWRREHEIRRYVELVGALGAPFCGTDLEFPLGANDRASLAAEPRLRRALSRDYVCVHPGSQLASRRWPAERFAAVAEALAADGYTIVITGTAAERALAERVAGAMHASAIDLCGRTTLGTVAALIDGARLLVANDTGVVHIAAARRTPSVSVSCGADVHRWRPLDTRRHRVLYRDVACRPCRHAECPIDHLCATGVSSADAIGAARDLLTVFA